MNEKLDSLRVYLAFFRANISVHRDEVLAHSSDYQEYLKTVALLPQIFGSQPGRVEFDPQALLSLDQISGISKEDYERTVNLVFGDTSQRVAPPAKASSTWYENYIDYYTRKDKEQGESLRRQVDEIWNRFDAMIRKDHPDRSHADESENVECIEGLMNPEAKDRACGLVAGRVQSGKTRNYIGLVLKAFSEGWNTVIVLTSNNTALAKQTHERLKADIVDHGGLNPHWLYRFNETLNWDLEAPWERSGQYFGLSQKEDDQLDKIIKWLDGLGEQRIREMKLLVVDDEADSATPDTTAGQTLELTMDDIGRLINKMSGCNERKALVAAWLKDITDAVCHIDGDEWPDGDCSRARKIYGMLNSEDGRTLVNEFRRCVKSANKDKDIFELCLDGPKYGTILGLGPNCEIDNPDYPGQKISLSALVKDVFDRRASGNDPSKKVFAAIIRCLFLVEVERSKINRMLCQLISRHAIGGFKYSYANAGYIAYTATPAANLVNEANAENPLAADFIFSMEVPRKYFGFEKIFGESAGDNDSRLNLNIAGIMYPSDDKVLSSIHELENEDDDIPIDKDLSSWGSMRDAIAWLFCTAAVRKMNWDALPDDVRKDEIEKEKTDGRWTTMLFNIDHRMFVHQKLQQKLYDYLKRLRSTQTYDAAEFQREFIQRCEKVWMAQTAQLTPGNFRTSCPDYFVQEEDWARLAYPVWEKVKDTIRDEFFSHLVSGENPDANLDLGRVHIVSINSYKCREGECPAFDGKNNLRKFTHPEKNSACHIWILCGGNTISRGLTLPGLTVSYFDRVRDQSAIDTITQMGRWFGYREGYELLPRIWMPESVIVELKKMCHLESEMHRAIKLGFAMGHSPKNSEHRLELLSYGRPLSSRAAAYTITDFGFNQAFDSFKTLCASRDARHAMLERTCEFLRNHQYQRDLLQQPEERAQYVQSLLRYPYYKGIEGSQLATYLGGLKQLYPAGDAQRSVQSLIDEIDRALDCFWDVVINNPQTNIVYNGDPSLNGIHLASKSINGNGNRISGCDISGGAVVFGKMSNTDFRGNFARIPKKDLAYAECKIIEMKARQIGAEFHPEFPGYNSVHSHLVDVRERVRTGDGWVDERLREYYGVSRMTGDAYRDAVFSLPQNENHNPILQITLVNVPDQLRDSDDLEPIPFVVLSFYWPGHPITGYFTGKVGVTAEGTLDDWSLAKAIGRIVSERKFVHKDELKELLGGRDWNRVQKRVFDSALRYTRMGYRLYSEHNTLLVNRRDPELKDGIYYSTEWCPDGEFLVALRREVESLGPEDGINRFRGILRQGHGVEAWLSTKGWVNGNLR